jgi:hypothetical protein
MKITACVCYPVYVEVEVPDMASEDEKRAALLDKADEMVETSTITPVIHECSDESITG